MSIFRSFTIDTIASINIRDRDIVFKRIDKEKVELIESVKSIIRVSRILSIPNNSSIELRPLPPSGYGINVDFLYISLPQPLSLIPKTQTLTTIDIPIDIGIYVNNNLIHKISPSIIKYALYGPPNTGVLCRYIDSNIIANTPKDYLGIMHISMINNHKEVVNINKIIIPIKGLIVCLYNKQKPIYNLVHVDISNENYVEVYTDTKIPSEDTEVLCFNTIDNAKYIMLYGA
ncbi:Protein of unknown function DUF432 [Ignisphaera aggregans DSM 17230]|uniref:DUF432 domain-containing protein n=1 Tax=Ignisphaera aggregans (strain DSM 17230 / JCM 13409 / AQ1.S1) TaxID=583356 RepID=E0SQ38_IGNAA|nr:Protein of unknown function DUF432 [Ignisphaera aggregans DSM 17230]